MISPLFTDRTFYTRGENERRTFANDPPRGLVRDYTGQFRASLTIRRTNVCTSLSLSLSHLSFFFLRVEPLQAVKYAARSRDTAQR